MFIIEKEQFEKNQKSSELSFQQQLEDQMLQKYPDKAKQSDPSSWKEANRQ